MMVYYAGHAWKKQGDIKNAKEWHDYLDQFSILVKINAVLILKEKELKR